MISAKTCFKFGLLAATSATALSVSTVAQAGGEAGPITLRDQGFFYVGVRPTEVENGTAALGQMYVGFQLPAESQHQYPLVLVHGGGGQSTDWFGTPDGRDGWRDYFLAAGFDVYYIDRPGFGRSPNNTMYGDLQPPATFEQLSELFMAPSQNFPGGGGPESEEVQQRVASSNPGPSVDNAVLQENLVELLERIGPAIMVTYSAGGPSGWLALDAAPDLVAGVLAIETAGDFAGGLAPLMNWEPALDGDTLPTVEVASETEGLEACNLQPEDAVHTLPAFEGKPILGIVSSHSPMFTPRFHCTIEFLNQAGANAELVRLDEEGLDGYGHFMSDETDSDRIVNEILIPWLAAVE